LIYNSVVSNNSIFFISDLSTYEGQQLFKLNYLLNPSLVSLTNIQLGDINYYNHVNKNKFVNSTNKKFDLVVVCANNTNRLPYGIFNNISKFVIGVVDINLRPDFFDFYLPPINGSSEAIQTIIDTATIAYLNRSF
jgi:hypothetical protein